MRLPEGSVGKAWSDSPRDNPYEGNGKLALADRKLNQVYGDLLPQLKSAARKALEKEQREWKTERERNARDGAEGGDPTRQIYEPVLEGTWKRAVELKALPNGYRLFNLGESRALIFKGTESPDGRHAIGWTAVPAYRKSDPVDWKDWDTEDPWDIEEMHVNGDEPMDSDPRIINCVVDLRQKKTVALPTDLPGKALGKRGYVAATWRTGENGRSHALVQSETEFHTINFWLVTIDPAGTHVADLAPELEKQVLQVAAAKRPGVAPALYKDGLMFGSRGLDHREIAFHGQSADIPFVADIPKNWDAILEVKGWITVSLANGRIEKAWSDTPPDDPFANDAGLKKADGALNRIYAALLRATVSEEERGILTIDQRDWVVERDNEASKAMSEAVDFDDDQPSIARDKSLLESTARRTEKLKKQLDALQGKGTKAGGGR